MQMGQTAAQSEHIQELSGRLEAHRVVLLGLLNHMDAETREAIRKALGGRAVADGAPPAMESGFLAEAAALASALR